MSCDFVLISGVQLQSVLHIPKNASTKSIIRKIPQKITSEDQFYITFINRLNEKWFVIIS